MRTAAKRTRTFPARPVTTVLLACVIALVASSATAQAPDPSEAEMRDLREKARTASSTEASPASQPGFTEAELRDLRNEVEMQGSAKGGGPALHGLTALERADLRSEAISAARGHAHPIGLTEAEQRDLRAAARTRTPLVTTPGFTTAELADLRTEARTVVPRSSGPVRAFTEAELRDLRSLAHDAGIARNADALTETR